MQVKKTTNLKSKVKFFCTVLSIALLSGLVVTLSSCNNDDEFINPDPEPYPEFSLDMDRMAMIAAFSQEYENAILDILSERDQMRSRGISDAFDFSERLSERFSQRITEYVESTPSVSLRSVAESSELNAGELQTRLDILQSLWFALPSMKDSDNNNATVEELIEDMQKVSDNFVLTIVNDNSLSEVERQLIVEEIVFRTNLATITIDYGDQIRGEPTTRFLRRAVRWVVNNARCIALSATAAADCFAAISDSSRWARCVESTAKAVNCW